MDDTNYDSDGREVPDMQHLSLNEVAHQTIDAVMDHSMINAQALGGLPITHQRRAHLEGITP